MNRGLKVLASWVLQWTLEVSTSSLDAGCCTPNNNCLTCCTTPGIIRIISIPIRIHCCQSWMSLSSVAKRAGCGYPQGFCFRAMGRPSHWSTLSYPLCQKIRCSRILQIREEIVVEHHLAWSTNESLSADPHLATALEEVLKEIVVKGPSEIRWNTVWSHKSVSYSVCMVEDSVVPQVCLLRCLHGDSRGTPWAFSFVVSKSQIRHQASEAYILIIFCFLYCSVDSSHVCWLVVQLLVTL